MSSPSSSRAARTRGSGSSPNAANSVFHSEPSPAPNTSRPPESRSSEAVSRATFCGRRRARMQTITPRRTRSVLAATAAIVIHGSATGASGSL